MAADLVTWTPQTQAQIDFIASDWPRTAIINKVRRAGTTDALFGDWLELKHKKPDARGALISGIGRENLQNLLYRAESLGITRSRDLTYHQSPESLYGMRLDRVYIDLANRLSTESLEEFIAATWEGAQLKVTGERVGKWAAPFHIILADKALPNE